MMTEGAGEPPARLPNFLLADQFGRVLDEETYRGVPRMLRRMIGRLLPRDPAHWCALDWEGQLGAPIRGAHGPLVAAVYGADGVRRTWTALRADAVSSAIVAKLVERATAR